MPVDPEFAAAFIDGSDGKGFSTTRILGVRLRPFCLWHRLLLNTIESPFMQKGAVSFLDLRKAVGVCRLCYGDCRIRKPWVIPSLIYAWVILRSMLASSAFLFRRRDKTADKKENALQRALRRRVEGFLIYCGDYLQKPEFSIHSPPSPRGSSANTKRGRGPDEIEHASDLIGFGMWTEKEVWEMPLGKANWYRAYALRNKGLDVDFIDLEERKFQAELKEALKEQQHARPSN